MEAKGRVRPPSLAAITDAKYQATRCVSASGQTIWLHAACFAYFQVGILRFLWEDPPSKKRGSGGKQTSGLGSRFRGNNRSGNTDPPDFEFEIENFDENDVWRQYYRHAFALSQSEAAQQDVDCVVTIHPEVLERLRRSAWTEAHEWAIENPRELVAQYHADGVQLKAGPSWNIREDRQ